MKRNKNKRGGGRSVRYTQEGVRAADEMMGDLTAGRSALNEQSPYNGTLQDDLGSVVSQATDGTRLNRLAEALAQVAIEHSRNPAANEGALSVYAEALNENTDADSRRAILQQADQIVQESFPDGRTTLPSTLFAANVNTVPDASTMDMASEPEMAGPITRDEAIRQALRDIPAESPEIAATMPVRAGAEPSPILPTPSGVAVALGDPTPNPEMAAQAMQGVVGRSLLPMTYGSSGQFEAIRDTTPPLFQQYVTQPNEPVISADPTGELALRPYLDAATGESFMGSQGLFEGLSEYPQSLSPRMSTLGGPFNRITLEDRIALRRAQEINDQMAAAYQQHVNAGGLEEDFYNSPLFQNFQQQYKDVLGRRSDPDAIRVDERPARLAELLGTGSLGDRPRGATVLESGSNPVATYNPLIAGLPGDTVFDREREFNAIYGKDLLSTLFSPSQYRIAVDNRPRDVARNEGFEGMGFDRYEGGLAAFTNLLEAVNAAAANRNLDLRFALSPNQPTTDLAGSQRLGNDVNAALLNFLATQPYSKVAPLADASAMQQELSTRGVGLLSSLLAGQGMDTLPTGTIPVPIPDSISFRSGRPALPYGGRLEPQGIDKYERKLERASMSPQDRAMESLLRAFSTDPAFARSGSRTVNPYRLFPQAARSMGIYFDPFTESLGGAFIEGTSPRLPPELAAHLYANALGIEPSMFRDNVVSGLASGLDGRNVDSIFSNKAAFQAYSKPPLIPRASLLNGLRLLPDSVVPNARSIINEALERGGSAPAMPDTGALPQGMRPAELPADDDLSALPSLYDVPNSSFALNRMSLPMRRGILGNLMTA